MKPKNNVMTNETSKPLKKNIQKRKVPYFMYPLAGCISLIAIYVIALTAGQYSISVADTFHAIFGKPASIADSVVIWELRIPRTLVAMLVGIALSISGLIYQSTFQNELVSPDIIGVSSGASVGVAVGLFVGLPVMLVSALGFMFGVLAMVLTILISRIFKNKSPLMLVIAGILVGGLMSSIVSLITAFANDSTMPSIVFWLLGSFTRAKMTHIWIMLPILLFACIFLFLISGKILNNVALGREEAKSKGINYQAWRLIIIGVGTVLTAVSVAVAGSIGWVGLAIPHISRLLVGHTAQRTIPITIAFGGSFMMLADILSRSISQAEIPVGAIAGILGIVIFLIILVTRKGAKYDVD